MRRFIIKISNKSHRKNIFQHPSCKIKIFKFLLLFSLSPLLPFSSSHAQAFNDIEWYDLDSLLSVLPGLEGDKRLQTLNFLAASLSFENKKESENYASQALELARKLGDRKAEADAYRNLGRKEFYDGNYPQALNYYQQALVIYEDVENFYLEAQILEDISTTHFFAGNYDKTFEIMNKALSVYRQKKKEGFPIGDLRDTMTLFSRIGLPYRLTGRSDTARLIYLRYLDVGEKNNFEITDMMVHHGLLAMCYYEISNYDSALYYLKKSFNVPIENISVKALRYQHRRYMGLSYLEKGKIDSAIFMFKTSLDWFSERGFLRQSQSDARILGDIYKDMGKISEAEKYYIISEGLLEEMIQKRSFYRYDILKYTVSFGYELYLPVNKKDMAERIYEQAVLLFDEMYELYYEKDRLREAITYLDASADAKDTLRVLTRNRESIEIQTKYETERKDSEIIRLSQQNELKELKLMQTRWLLFGLAGMVLLIILLALVLIRQSRLRAAQEKLIIQQKLFRSQMNPHFIFNSLGSIQSSIINEEPDKAVRYLSRFSKLMRSILDSTTEELIPLQEEINTIENYLALQKVRYADKFDYNIDIDPDIDTDTVMIPPMLAQPFIENAIEHGIKNKIGKGRVDVRIWGFGDLGIFEVEDDGVGRERARDLLLKQEESHKSLATVITRERIAALNRKSKKKITLEIIDLTDDKGNARGTLVRFGLPLH